MNTELEGERRLFELSDLDVESVGLVRRGALRKPFLFVKSEDGDDYQSGGNKVSSRAYKYTFSEGEVRSEFTAKVEEKMAEGLDPIRATQEVYEQEKALVILDDLWRRSLEARTANGLPLWMHAAHQAVDFSDGDDGPTPAEDFAGLASELAEEYQTRFGLSESEALIRAGWDVDELYTSIGLATPREWQEALHKLESAGAFGGEDFVAPGDPNPRNSPRGGGGGQWGPGYSPISVATGAGTKWPSSQSPGGTGGGAPDPRAAQKDGFERAARAAGAEAKDAGDALVVEILDYAILQIFQRLQREGESLGDPETLRTAMRQIAKDRQAFFALLGAEFIEKRCKAVLAAARTGANPPPGR